MDYRNYYYYYILTTTIWGWDSCKNIWGWDENGSPELFLNGECGNPDGDPKGPWCFTNAGTCAEKPVGPKSRRSPNEWDVRISNFSNKS